MQKIIKLEDEILHTHISTAQGEDLYITTNFNRNHPINSKTEFKLGSIVIFKQKMDPLKILSFKGEINSI